MKRKQERGTKGDKRALDAARRTASDDTPVGIKGYDRVHMAVGRDREGQPTLRREAEDLCRHLNIRAFRILGVALPTRLASIPSVERTRARKNARAAGQDENAALMAAIRNREAQ